MTKTKKKKAPTLPTSFRVCKDVIAYRNLLRKPPRARGFHPSGMSRLCPVKHWFYDHALEDFASDDPVKVRAAMATVRMVLDTPHDASPGRLPGRLDGDLFIGDAIHQWVQYSFGLLGYLWGGWRCVICRTKISENGYMPRVTSLDVKGQPLQVSAPCLACNGRNLAHDTPWLYVELGIRNDWDVVGHCDGVFIKPWAGGTLKAALEIKSINENGYYGRYGDPLPKPEHVEQASHYVWGLREKYEWLADLEHIYFVYICKNAIRDWKEFLVTVNSEAIDKTKQVITAIRAAEEPPLHLRTCDQVYAKLATTCPLVERCFGEAPPLNFFDPNVSMEEFPL